MLARGVDSGLGEGRTVVLDAENRTLHHTEHYGTFTLVRNFGFVTFSFKHFDLCSNLASVRLSCFGGNRGCRDNSFAVNHRERWKKNK